MQRQSIKNIAVLFALIITTFHVSNAQNLSNQLKIADSLFQSKRYTQSFQQYQEVMKQNYYTPAMLLKMAFIQEGLGNIGNALYYLNLYQQTTNDKAAIFKMEELAEKYDLQGYEATDREHFFSFYRDYYPYVTWSLAAITIFLLSTIVYTKRKLKKKPIFGSVAIACVLILFAVHLNMGERISTGILTAKTSYIMSGPSAAAPLIEITKDGHRVEVIGKKDVWYKILWEGKVAYVRDQMIVPAQL